MESPFFFSKEKVMAEKKKILLLIDADMVAFAHCAAEEYGKSEEEEVSFGKIASSMDNKIKFLSQRLDATTTINLLSGDLNMRNKLASDYKANRADVWRPDNLKNAKAYLRTCHDAISMNNLEADDLVGILARNEVVMDIGKNGHIKSIECVGPCQYDEVIVASLDKDLAQVISGSASSKTKIRHYRWERNTAGGVIGEQFVDGFGLGELHQIIKTSPKGVVKKEVKGCGPLFFLYQLLIGDGTDGIIGCGIREPKVYQTGKKAGQSYMKRVGVGSGEAFDMLNKCKSYAEGLDKVVTEYVFRFADGWETEIVKNGRLLFMSNKIIDGHKVMLWHHRGVKEYFNLKTEEIE